MSLVLEMFLLKTLCSVIYFCLSMMQVELAHGGRGPSSSERRGGYGGGGGGGGSGGGRFGVSRHSEYRGIFLINYKIYIVWRPWTRGVCMTMLCILNQI